MVTLRAGLLIAGNDLRRRLRNRSFLVQAFLGPLALALVISAAFSGGFGFDVVIGVVNLDDSELASGVEQQLLRGDAEGVAFATVNLVETARQQVDDGDIGAALVIPEGFAESLAGPTPAHLELVVDESWPVPAAVARSVAGEIGARVDAGRLAAFTLVAAGEPAPRPEDLADIDLPVQVDLLDAGEELSPAATVAPGMGLLFLFFTVGSIARGLLEERRQHVLDRIRAAPASMTAILLGKAIGVLLVGVASLATLWAATGLLLGADWGDTAGVALVVLAATVAVGGISGVVAAAARNEQSAEMLATMVAFTFGIAGGSLIPLSELPDSFLRLSAFTPNGWAQRAFAELSAGGAGPGDVLGEVGILLLWAAAALALAAVLLPRRLAAR